MDLERAFGLAQEKIELAATAASMQPLVTRGGEVLPPEERVSQVADRIRRLPVAQERAEEQGWLRTTAQVSFKDEQIGSEKLVLDLIVREQPSQDNPRAKEVFDVWAQWWLSTQVGMISTEIVSAARLHRDEVETARLLGLLEESVAAAEVATGIAPLANH